MEEASEGESSLVLAGWLPEKAPEETGSQELGKETSNLIFVTPSDVQRALTSTAEGDKWPDRLPGWTADVRTRVETWSSSTVTLPTPPSGHGAYRICFVMSPGKRTVPVQQCTRPAYEDLHEVPATAWPRAKEMLEGGAKWPELQQYFDAAEKRLP